MEIRGFLYQTKQGAWVLSKEPNLPSCCVGSEKKIEQQIVLEGDFSQIPSYKALTFKGELIEEPKWDGEGKKIQHWVLKNGIPLEQESSLLWLFLPLFIAACLLLRLAKARKFGK